MSGYSSAVQQRNPELVDLLRTDFQHRNEPNFAWKSAVSSFMAIPGLIAIWPMSIGRLDSQTDRVRDVGGGGYHLTTVNDPYFRHHRLVPVVAFNGANEYAFRTAGAASWASVLGTEAYIHAAQQGIFFGGWFKFDDALGTAETLIGKWDDAGNEKSYRIRREADGDAVFAVSPDGTAVTNCTLTGGFDTAGMWYLALARFDNANNELKLWVNGDTNTAVYNNTIFDSTADFFIGAHHGPAEYFDGMASLNFLSACKPADVIPFSLFQQTRAMFGV